MPDAAGAPVLVEVVIGSFVESRHRGAVAVADRSGQLLMACGDVDASLFDLACLAASGMERLPVGEAPSPLARCLTDATGGAAEVCILPGGVCIATLAARQIGIALRINDAAPRAIGTAMMALLRRFDAVADSHLGDLAALTTIRNAKGEVIATVRPRIGLDG